MFRIKRREQLHCGYELFIAAISVLSIVNLALEYLPGVKPDAIAVISIVNGFLTLIFVYDFSLRFITAPSRSYYFFRNFGWADLLGIVPVLRIFRLFRIFKVYRLVKKFGLKKLGRYVITHRPEAALYIIVFLVIFIVEVGSYLVLIAESTSPVANITTAVDAVWWVYLTITTVGYGDVYPVTLAGRIVGILVMTMGVAVFATFAGYVSSKLLAPVVRDNEIPEPPPDRDTPAAAHLAEIKKYLAERERINGEIIDRIEQLERLLAREAAGVLEFQPGEDKP